MSQGPIAAGRSNNTTSTLVCQHPISWGLESGTQDRGSLSLLLPAVHAQLMGPPRHHTIETTCGGATNRTNLLPRDAPSDANATPSSLRHDARS